VTESEVLAILRRTGVFREGHFRLTSGKHSDLYLQCAQLFQYPEEGGRVGAALAGLFTDQPVDTVIGPALGGIIVAYEVARALGVRALFAERENGAMTLRRGFTLRAGERVLVVEDVLTTGGSVREVMDVVRQHGAVPVAVGALVDRSGGRVRFEVPHRVLVSLTSNIYDPEDCPLCRRGLPVVKPGSRPVEG
jgi:orotate phosphoribosyltransferase